MSQPVDSSRVDPIDAFVERRMNGIHGLLVVLRAPGELPSSAAHGPCAHADRRDLQIARTQSLFLHSSILPGRRIPRLPCIPRIPGLPCIPLSYLGIRAVGGLGVRPRISFDDAADRLRKSPYVGGLLDELSCSQFQRPRAIGVM